MSDPMTNSEVEDVLSSIRRLVSDEKRSDPTVPEQERPARDRLVLTPSLRVSDDSSASPDRPAECTDTGDDTQSTEADDSRSDATDADGGSSAQEQMTTPFLLDGQLDRTEETSGESIDNGMSDSGADLAVDFKDLESAGVAEEESGDTANTPETLGAKIAALETLIAGRVEEWEPDQAGTDAYAGTEPPAMDWDSTEDRDDSEVTDDAALCHDTTEAAEAPQDTEASHANPEADPSAFSPEDNVLDEDALRELVSEIVRQELQGILGERITRNVRKLVRRELHRALAAQDLQ